MKDRSRQPIRWGLVAFATFWMMVIVPLSAAAAPYAALVMDARSGEVLHARNADTRLHPASLTKMMTLPRWTNPTSPARRLNQPLKT